MADENQITVFAKTNFRNKEVPFGIKTDDRRRHMYVIGKTGMGKTTLMENMAIQDIRNGHGVAFLDPHGDSVQKILDCVPPSRINDVIYFNPADMEHPIAFNILEAVDPKYKHLVASGLMGVFTKIWANLWSARMEYILNNTIMALLDSPGNTMLGITRMYVDKKYRKKIVDNIKDPMVRAFWVDEFANYNEKYRTEAIAPIQNKVGQFLSNSIIRNIVGQPKSTIDLREIMDQQKILIMDLSKGKVGEDNSALLGAMLVTKLQLAAMSRTDIPEKERRDFYLYVDEFQNFATESFATILSEARKYRLNLVVGHQYIAQLEQDKNTVVRDAIFGNVGTMVVFRVGAADAEFMETEFDPIFTPTDLVNLPKYSIVLKLMINGVASEPFSASTLPPHPDWVMGNRDKVIKVSRERYSNSVAEVEEKISRWMSTDTPSGSAAVLLGADQDQDQEMSEQNESEVRAPEQAAPAPLFQISPRPAIKTNTPAPLETVRLNVQQEPAQEIPVPAPREPLFMEQPGFAVSSNEESKRPAFHAESQAESLPEKITEKPRLQQTAESFQDIALPKTASQPQSPARHETPKPARREEQRRGLGGQDRHDRRDRHGRNKENKQQQKKDNPIWNTVANIHTQKNQEHQQKLSQAVAQIIKSQPKQEQKKHEPARRVESPQSEERGHERKVLQPGQAQKF